jgi:hypothetical protein
MSIPDSEITRALSSLVFGRNAQRRKLAEETRQYATRSGKIAKAYRQKILNKALATAGIDQEEIRKRQLENDEADRKFLASIEPILTENARLTNARNKLLIEGLQSKYKKFLFPKPHPMPPPPPPQLPLWDVLTTAAYVVGWNPKREGTGWEFFSPIPNFNYSLAPFENLIHFTSPADGNAEFAIVAYFPWTAPLRGTVNYLSVLAFNGSNWWGAKHGCVHTSVKLIGQAGITAFNQTVVNAELYDPAPQTFLDEDHEWLPGCSSDVGTNLIDDPVYLTGSFPVGGSNEMLIAVSIYIKSNGDEAIGELDFATNNKSINITGIVLNLTAD